MGRGANDGGGGGSPGARDVGPVSARTGLPQPRVLEREGQRRRVGRTRGQDRGAPPVRARLRSLGGVRGLVPVADPPDRERRGGPARTTPGNDRGAVRG